MEAGVAVEQAPTESLADATRDLIVEFAKFNNRSFFEHYKVHELIACAKANDWPPMIVAAILCLESEPDTSVVSTVRTFCNELIVSPTWDRGRVSLLAYAIARCSTLPDVKAMIPNLCMWIKELCHPETMKTNLLSMLAQTREDRLQQLAEGIRAYFKHD